MLSISTNFSKYSMSNRLPSRENLKHMCVSFVTEATVFILVWSIWRAIFWHKNFQSDVSFCVMGHQSPELCKTPGRFVSSSLSLFIVTTWKSMRSYVEFQKKNDPFKAKKSYRGSKVGFGTLFLRSKMRKSFIKIDPD